ncbi:hypothetical protein O181_019787 [Austropuccinia psidii MF-1]|uniref:Integrase catalytic domain-containing protein n=1 Tax=Austropuccinia psidii MF-1 TaxID=1389203 RepID=A0A9Q3GUR7_9BASI|nr:hypothetical protein [Austropuccinia psidii MF-1]
MIKEDYTLYDRAKYTCVMTLTDRTLISTILHECHDSDVSGHLKEDRTLERVKALPPGGDRSFNEFLVLLDRYRKPTMFLPFHKDDMAIGTAKMTWNRHSQTHGLAEIIIQTLEDLIRRFCAYGLELKDPNDFTHDWCTLIPALELAYKKPIHSSTGKAQAMLEEDFNPRLSYETLKNDSLVIHPTAISLEIMVDKARNHENRCMQDSFKYAKQRWDKSHKPTDFKLETWY